MRQCLPEPGHTLFTFSFSFILPRWFSAECRGQKKKKNSGLRSNNRTVPEWRTNKIRNTKAEGYLRPRRKEAPFTHYWCLSCSLHTPLQNTVQTFNTTYFQVLDVNSKQTYISEEDGTTCPEDGVYSLSSPQLDGGKDPPASQLVTVWFKSGDASAPRNTTHTRLLSSRSRFVPKLPPSSRCM